jgi:hypothetical protein
VVLEEDRAINNPGYVAQQFTEVNDGGGAFGKNLKTWQNGEAILL